MITWRKAPRVAPGDPILSTQADQLAQAWNDRLRNGPALPWRRVNHLLHAFYSMRNPDGDLTPSVAEFFQFYQFLDPKNASWPDTDAGLPAGANVNSQWPAFVFGIDGPSGRGVWSEADRLTNPGAGGLELDAMSANPRDLWALGKKQRGAYDPATGGLGAPALSAASSWATIRYNATSPHGTDFGGFLPGPAITGNCATSIPVGNGDTVPIPNYAMLFTNLLNGATKTYGTCPENPGDLAGVAVTPFAYILIKFNGSYETLDATQWIEGPYTADPVLRKTQNGFYGRAINRFAGDFRGTADQVAQDGVGTHVADVQAFLTSQYLLAPARGMENAGAVAPIYPVLPYGQTYSPHAGFVIAAAYVEIKGLSGGAAVQLLRDGKVAAVVSPVAQKDGTWQAIAIIPKATAGGVWSWRWAGSQLALGPGQSVTVELAELMDYKPNVADWYLVLRCGGIQFDSGGMDGSGLTFALPEAIYNDYAANGVIRSQQGHVGLQGQFSEISSNAVFDSARRLSKCVRWAHRWNLTGYAVVGGKSVLWFNRLARGLGNDVPLDIFEGLGPARTAIASGAIVWGRTYVVKVAAVVYGGVSYAVGKTFTGLQGVTTYTTNGGQVWELEGIRTTAEPAGFTNEWLMGVELKPFNPSSSSLWKTDAFTDYVGNFDRCVFCDPAAAYDQRLLHHLAFGNGYQIPLAIITPENPSTYRYTPSSNNYYPRINNAVCDEGDTDCIMRRQRFYKSCPIFDSWPAVESVQADGADVVKVTLATRLQYDADTAPGSVARDVSTWDVTALRNQPYRTAENGIMEYMVWLTNGTNPSLKVGDQAFSSPCASFGDAPYGSIMPTFYFTQLIPRPHVDVEGIGTPIDAYCYHDMMGLLELDIRAGCSAFVDGQTTAELTCDAATNTNLYDYSYEVLMAQATGAKWISPTATATTDALTNVDVRPDRSTVFGGRPFGFGPLPSAYMSAEVFNWYGAAIDLLDTFRVMVPATLQFKTDSGIGLYDSVTFNAAGVVAPPGPLKLGTSGNYALYVTGVYGPPATSTPGTWADSSSGSSTWAWVPGDTYSAPYPTPWQVQATATASSYRWSPQNADIELAMGPFAGGLSSQPSIYGRITTVTTLVTSKPLVPGATNGTAVHGAGGSDDTWSTGASGDSGGIGTAVKWENGTLTTTVNGPCGRFSGGAVPIPSGLSGYAYVARNIDAGTQIDNTGGPNSTVTLTSSVLATPSITVPLTE